MLAVVAENLEDTCTFCFHHTTWQSQICSIPTSNPRALTLGHCHAWQFVLRTISIEMDAPCSWVSWFDNCTPARVTKTTPCIHSVVKFCNLFSTYLTIFSIQIFTHKIIQLQLVLSGPCSNHDNPKMLFFVFGNPKLFT